MSEAAVRPVPTPPRTGLTKGTALDVGYQEKDNVKALGAVWDSDLRLWYVPAGRDLRPFLRWLPREVRIVDAAGQGSSPVSAELSQSPPGSRLSTQPIVELGQEIGAELDQRLPKVARSVTVVSPFLTPALLNRLRELQGRG